MATLICAAIFGVSALVVLNAGPSGPLAPAWWGALALVLLATGAFVGLVTYAQVRRAPREDPGRCEACGYDVGLASWYRCPECGHVRAHALDKTVATDALPQDRAKHIAILVGGATSTAMLLGPLVAWAALTGRIVLAAVLLAVGGSTLAPILLLIRRWERSESA